MIPPFFFRPLCLALVLTGVAQAQPSDPAPFSIEEASPALGNRAIYSSVVRIECATQVFDYKQPWSTGRFGGGIGTGFLIGENRFLTNAHVVSNARRIIINKRGSDIKHPARIVHIAHDCDLALLEVEDFSAFASLPPLTISDRVPQLEQQVRAVGYPVGGNRLSVTRGVVSRIDFRPYSHSQIDMHLVVQIDAAINPGNSGGPVLLGEDVVGVAFQGLRSADNTGYMIPTPVINRFLKDIEDGRYDRYVDLGAAHFPLFNPTMKAALGLPVDSPGVLISDVTPDGPCDGVLQRGDVLVKIDGFLINNAGNIEVDNEEVLFHEIVERKFAGDAIALAFLREGEIRQETIVLKPFPASRIYAISYDRKPEYFFRAGLLFQPMDVNLIATYSLDDPSARYLYQNYIEEGLFRQREDLIVLTKVVDDQLTTSMTEFTGKVLQSINGEPVGSLAELATLMTTAQELDYLILRFEGTKKPLVLPVDQMESATQRLMSTLGMNAPSLIY